MIHRYKLRVVQVNQNLFVRVRLVPPNMFKRSSNVFADRTKAVLLLWILCVICASCLSLSYCFVCCLQPCGHLLGKRLPLGSLVCDGLKFLCFVTFLYGVHDQVWYLIVSIPDRCLLPYFKKLCT